MLLTALVWFHTGLSIVALIAGCVVVRDLLHSKSPDIWTSIFLVTAIATSVTGFFFPYASFGPSHWVGVFSLIVLGLALLGANVYRYEGPWRWVYAGSMVAAQYFLVFVLIAQAFMKVPVLHAAAPTLSEPPFAIAQTVALLLFVGLAVIAARSYHYRPAIPGSA